MSDIQYSINPVEKKPDRKTSRPRGSNKYAPIVETFLESDHGLVRVDGTDKEANYLAGQLKKLCKLRGIDSVDVSVRNKRVYLERIK